MALVVNIWQSLIELISGKPDSNGSNEIMPKKLMINFIVLTQFFLIVMITMLRYNKVNMI